MGIDAADGMGPIVWVFDSHDLKAMNAHIRRSPIISFDLETTGLYDYAVYGSAVNGGVPAIITMATFTVPDSSDDEAPITYVLPLGHPESPFQGPWRTVFNAVMSRIHRHGTRLVGQNIKFDMRWTYRFTGLDLSDQVEWDTQVSSHLLDETRSTRLKVRAADTFGIPEWDDFDLSKPGASQRVNIWTLGEYAARDTFWTWRLYVLHRLQLMELGDDGEWLTPEEREDRRLGPLAQWVAMPMVASLTRIEQNGFALDKEWTQEELSLHVIGRETGLDELAERYGLPRDKATVAATSNWFKELTTLAVEEGDLRITAMTKGGAPQWNKSVLVRQARVGSEVAEAILSTRAHTKKAEYLQSWLDHLAPDGRIHSSYHAGRVVTGRLSSSDPNMQQVTKVLKPAFIPSPGHVIIDLDYSQIELRVAAFISRCEPMLQAFRDGQDLHRLLAARLTGKSVAEVTADERQAGKSANFGLLYGMMAPGFREYAEDVYDVHFTMEQAEGARQVFFDMWTGMAEWHERVRQYAHEHGQVVSPLGRIRRLPGIWSGDFGLVSFSERAAINSPVQGFASDIMQLAAASIQGFVPGFAPIKGARVVGTVHDSIVVEAPIDIWEFVATKSLDRMLSLDSVLAEMGCVLDVPLAAEAQVGTRWGLSDVGVLV